MLKKVFKHIFRWWDEDDQLPHPLIYLVPPFLIEVLGVVIVLALIYGILAKLIDVIGKII